VAQAIWTVLVPQPKSSKDSDEGTLRDKDVADSGFIASTSDVGLRGEWERERDIT